MNTRTDFLELDVDAKTEETPVEEEAPVMQTIKMTVEIIGNSGSDKECRIVKTYERQIRAGFVAGFFQDLDFTLEDWVE